MFYKVIQQGDTMAVRLSPKNPERKYHPKWQVVGQSVDVVAISVTVRYGTLGLYLGNGEVQYKGASTNRIPCVLLLVGEQKLFIPKQCVMVLSQKEIEKVLDESKQTA